MARRVLVPLNMSFNELLNVLAQHIAGDPGAPVEGQFWYDSGSGRFKYRNGSATVDPVSRADHVGTQPASTISDFDDKVRTNRLDQLAAPTADVVVNGQKITGLGAPSVDNDAARLVDVQAVAGGLSWKDSVRVATAGAGTLASDFENGDTIDGVVLSTDDRILIKNQADASENGIYSVNAAGAPSRTNDANDGDKIRQAAVFVESGTTNADTAWILVTEPPITVGVTDLDFTQFGAGTDVNAGEGLTKTGNTLDVGAGDGVVVNADDVAIDPAVVVRKFAADIGNGTDTQFDVPHNLGTRDITAQVRETSSPWDYVDVDVEALSTTQVRLRFAVAPSANQYRVVVHG